MTHNPELVATVAKILWHEADNYPQLSEMSPSVQGAVHAKAISILDAIRSHDAKSAVRIPIAGKVEDPDDYRDLHLVTRMEHGPGLTEG